MGQILQYWRVIAATLFSALLIALTFLLARGFESPSAAQASTESALLRAIATKDSDGDGLPDWEEALYGTSPTVTDTNHLGMTDGDAVLKGLIVPKAIADIPLAPASPVTYGEDGLPTTSVEGTLTASFAANFFSLYLAAKQTNGGADLSEADMQNIANRAMQSLSSSVVPAPDFKTAKDLRVAGSGAEAMKAFAADAEAVLRKNTTTAVKSELLYLQDALQKGDTTAYANISSIAKGYRESAIGLSVLSVPAELASTHLTLINALMRTSQVADDFAKAETDPLTTMLALQQYLPATTALSTTFVNIGQIYARVGISLPAGALGASFVNLIADMERERANKKP